VKIEGACGLHQNNLPLVTTAPWTVVPWVCALGEPLPAHERTFVGLHCTTPKSADENAVYAKKQN